MRDLPAGYVACQSCSWAGPLARYDRHMAERHPQEGKATVRQGTAAVPAMMVRVKKPVTGPNATEQRFHDTYLAMLDARYEALTFRMANGKRYTPDWIVFDHEDKRPTECIEVKSKHRFGSHNRAQVAFAQCRVEFPGLRWTWATWDRKAKAWRVET